MTGVTASTLTAIAICPMNASDVLPTFLANNDKNRKRSTSDAMLFGIIAVSVVIVAMVGLWLVSTYSMSGQPSDEIAVPVASDKKWSSIFENDTFLNVLTIVVGVPIIVLIFNFASRLFMSGMDTAGDGRTAEEHGEDMANGAKTGCGFFGFGIVMLFIFPPVGIVLLLISPFFLLGPMLSRQ